MILRDSTRFEIWVYVEHFSHQPMVLFWDAIFFQTTNGHYDGKQFSLGNLLCGDPDLRTFEIPP